MGTGGCGRMNIVTQGVRRPLIVLERNSLVTQAVLDNVLGAVGPTFVANDLRLCVVALQAEIIPMIDIMIIRQIIPDKGLNLQLPTSSEAKSLPHPQNSPSISKKMVQ